MDAGWFDMGYRPGQDGHAVIIGHLDTDIAAQPIAAFWNLHELHTGSIINLSGQRGRMLSFAVTALNVYPVDAFPLRAVFGPDSRPVLELLTCAGRWRGSGLGYSARLVVTASLIRNTA